MNFEPIFNATIYIQIHILAAVIAMTLTPLMIFMPKGNRRHKLFGRIWAIAMVIIALSSFFIHELDQFMGFSLIHLLSIITLVTLALGIRAIRQKRSTVHKWHMYSLIFGGLLIAGAFTLAPGRIIHAVFF